MPLFEDIFQYGDKCLSRFIKHSFDVVLKYLNIQTTLIYSSDIEKDESKKGQEKILEICSLLGADSYYNAIGGQELYDRSVFMQNGIKLYFLKTEIFPYRQFKNEFVSGLSMIDILMFNSPEEINAMLDRFELI